MSILKPKKQLAIPVPLWYACNREWISPGGLPGLQNRCRVALRAVVGSTPIHSRLNFRFLYGNAFTRNH